MSNFYLHMLRKSFEYSPHFLKQIFYLIKKGRFKNLRNYLWAMTLSREEGAALFDRYYAHNPLKAPYPERIELETTTFCRLKCPKCEHTYWKRPQKHMSFKQFKHVLDEFPDLKAISLSGIGHSTENPDFIKMIKLCSERGIFTQFFDPFLLIDEDISRKIIELGVNKIWVSFDGATKETYESMQVNSDFEKVKSNIKRMIELKKELNSPFPEICFHYIVTKDNYREMPLFIDLVKELTEGDPTKLKLIQFTKLIPFEYNKFLAPPKIPKGIINQIHKKMRGEKMLRLNLFNINDKRPPIDCCVAWMVPFITVDGECYPCCALTERNVRSQIMGKVMGNIFETPFRDIWDSRLFRQFKLDLKNGVCPKLCHWPKVCVEYDISTSKSFRQKFVEDKEVYPE